MFLKWHVLASHKSLMMMSTLHSCGLVFSFHASLTCRMQVLYNISIAAQILSIPRLSGFLQLRCSVWRILEKLCASYCLVGIWSIAWVRHLFSLNQSDVNLCSGVKVSFPFSWMKLNPSIV